MSSPCGEDFGNNITEGDSRSSAGSSRPDRLARERLSRSLLAIDTVQDESDDI